MQRRKTSTKIKFSPRICANTPFKSTASKAQFGQLYPRASSTLSQHKLCFKSNAVLLFGGFRPGKSTGRLFSYSKLPVGKASKTASIYRRLSRHSLNNLSHFSPRNFYGQYWPLLAKPIGSDMAATTRIQALQHRTAKWSDPDRDVQYYRQHGALCTTLRVLPAQTTSDVQNAFYPNTPKTGWTLLPYASNRYTSLGLL